MFAAIDIYERIRSLTDAKGIQVKTMLEQIGMNKNALSSMKSRGSFPGCDKLAQMADYLDCSVDYLMGRTDAVRMMSVNPDLSDDEQELLSYFRQLDSRGRRHVLTCAEDEANALAEKGTTETIA